jgi:ubiquinone/menaquinone biosynthesis C-methylase UbiE
MDMTNKQLSDEIAVQDSVAGDYTHVRYKKKYSEEYQRNWFLAMVHLINNKGLVLDNGCGVGYLASFFPVGSVIGFDISMGMLGQARSRIEDLVRGNSQDLPFPDATFEVIVCRSLLHHLPEPEKGMKEMDRVLKCGGEVIFAEPIESVLSYFPRRLQNEEHFSDVHRDFKRKDILSLIEREFAIEHVHHFGYIAYPVLGFPDIVDPLKKVPFQEAIATILVKADNSIAKIPFMNRQSWGIIVKARKRSPA